jgi:hypothetical protein
VSRLILKYGYPITAVVLAIFVWVIYRRIAGGGVKAVVLLAVVAVVVWFPGTFVFIYFWPRITVSGFRRAILRRGLGGGPIPVNTLYAEPERFSRTAAAGSVLATGTDDLLYLAGWLDVKAGPQVLHVPDMDGRYYSVQFTDPVSGANFAYVGTRTTGAGPDSFLLCTPASTGGVPPGMSRIDVPHGSALLIGRVFASDDEDRQSAYALAEQMQLSRPR